MHARLDQLEPACRSLLELLAVVGYRMDLVDVVALSGQPLERTAETLDQLVWRRLVDEAEDGRELSYELTHPLIQEAIYEGIGRAPPARPAPARGPRPRRAGALRRGRRPLRAVRRGRRRRGSGSAARSVAPGRGARAAPRGAGVARSAVDRAPRGRPALARRAGRARRGRPTGSSITAPTSGPMWRSARCATSPSWWKRRPTRSGGAS